MVVLDTNIIIDHLRQGRATETLLSKVNKTEGKDYLAISVITLQELYEGKSTVDEDKEKAMLSILSPLKVLDYNAEVAELSGKIARDLGKPIEFADAAIAGTCVFNDLELFTLNEKHFLKIPDLKLYRI